MTAELPVRTATAADAGAIGDLLLAVFGEAEMPMATAWLTGPHGDPGRWTVACSADRIVSTSVLLPLPLRLAGLDLPAGQIEFVATDPDFTGRGLVRRQFAVHHARSTAEGDRLQVIMGIPYFYRQFGYGYGLSYPDYWTVRADDLRSDPAVGVRPALPADLPALCALERLRPTAGITTHRPPALERLTWVSHLSDPPATGAERFFVAERSGEVVGWMSLTVRRAEGRIYLLPALATDAGATDALLAHALAQAPDLDLLAHDTPGTPYGARLRQVGTVLFESFMGIYTRIPDRVGFLRAIEPVLSERLTASALADAEGSVTISAFVDTLRVDYAGGRITAIEPVATVADPFERLECGVAPDWFPALALGRWGATELDRRIDDVSLGQHADVLTVLFPRLDSDIVTDF